MGGISEAQVAEDDGMAKPVLFKKESKRNLHKANASLQDINNKRKKAQITILLNISCAAMIFSLCLFHQTLPLKLVKYGG